MYLPQAVALPSSLGIEWDLFGRIHLAQEGEIEPAVVTSSVAVPISPATPLQPGQVYRDKTGPFSSRIGPHRRHFAIGDGPWRWEPSASKGKSIRSIFVNLFVFL